jgi:hypothetical protein
MEERHNDRRSARRRAGMTSVRAECRRGTLGLGPNILVRVGDISQSGTCLCLKVALSVKNEVEVTFEATGVPLIKRAGNVAWVRALDDGTVLVGIHFQKSLSFQELQAISK